MRVLFASIPALGHLLPIVSLAWACRAAGHEVVIAVAEHMDKAAATGLPVVDVAPGYDTVAVIEKALEDNPEIAQRWADPLQDDPSEWAAMFAATNRPLMDRTMELVRTWKPDLVVYEQMATFALMAAAAFDVPAVQRNLGIVRTGDMHQATADHLPDMCERYRVPRLPKPLVTIEHVTPSMLPFEEPEGWFMREVPYNGGTVLERIPERGERPRIAITMGTVKPTFSAEAATSESGEMLAGYWGLGPLDRLVGEAGKVDADFVLALGDVDPEPLGTLPPNIQPIGWTPLDSLLRTCSGVVHPGGGTTMIAVDAGIPQLLVHPPSGQGNESTAKAVLKRGVGLVTTEDTVQAEMLERLLTDSQMCQAAVEVQHENASLPSPAETVSRISELLWVR
jgi:UDP:flavonoid glycosyltransferase YjiC (YdhE family)